MLGILRFNSSDRGYYWCQMVINNVSLSPSPYGHFNHSQCTYLDAICHTDQLICAQNTRVQYMAIRRENDSCSLVEFNNISPTGTTTLSQEVTITNFLTTLEIVTVMVPKFPATEITIVTMSFFPTIEVISAIVAGIILFMLTILVVLSIVYIKKCKSQSKLNNYCIFIYPNNTCLI